MERRTKKPVDVGAVMSRLLLGLLVALTLLPFYLMLVNSFKNETNIVQAPFSLPLPFEVETYAKAWPQVVRPMLNSLLVTAAIILITCLVSLLAAYAFARFRFFLKEVLYFGVIALLMIPGFVLLIPQFIQIVSLGLFDTYWALILVPAAYQVAMGTFLLRSSIESIPSSLFEAATIDGASDRHIMQYIVLPMSKPILATVIIMTGLSSWNNYIWPLVASSSEATSQIAVALTSLVRDTYYGKGVLFAGYVCASLPIILLFSFSSKYFIEGLSQGAVKG
jgi:ABC-type glycerol-3-phosphate transport system permease component